jgi:ATP-dependent Clp protease ATP-binding subunit ClpA
MPGRLGLYDDYAKRVLALAQDEAWRVFHHGAIGPEHLMLGVLRAGAGDRDGWIVPVLNSLGLDLAKARKALEGLRGRGDPEQQLDQIPFTTEGWRVIDQATAEARTAQAERVTPKHVLLAALRDPGAEAVLQSLGLSSEAVREKIIDIPR